LSLSLHYIWCVILAQAPYLLNRTKIPKNCTNPLLQILFPLQHYKMKLFNMDESCRFEWIGLYILVGV
jgi:hypothetical protein